MRSAGTSDEISIVRPPGKGKMERGEAELDGKKQLDTAKFEKYTNVIMIVCILTALIEMLFLCLFVGSAQFSFDVDIVNSGVRTF